MSLAFLRTTTSENSSTCGMRPSLSARAAHLCVQRRGRRGDCAPAELVRRPRPAGGAVGLRLLGIAHDLGEHPREIVDEPVWVDRGAGAVLHLLDRDEP